MRVKEFFTNMPGGQKRAGKLLVGFFSLVLVFTLVSRGLDSFSIATVSTSKPTQGGISRKVTVQGTIQPLSQFAVSVPEGFLVKRSLVTPGSKVEEGEVLAVLDTDAIQKQLAEARRELERAQLNAAKNQKKTDVTESDPYLDAQTSLERAEEDLKLTIRNNEEKVARARNDLADVRSRRNRLFTEEYETADLESANKEVAQAERSYEDAVQAAEQAELSARRTVEDAKRKIEQVEESQREEEVSKAAEQESAQLDNRLNQLSLEEVQEKITRLQSLLETGGEIVSDQSGVVTQVSIEVGAITGSGGAFILADEDGGSIFEGTVEETSGKLLSVGDKVSMTLPGHNTAVSATIDGLTPPKEKGGDYTVTVRLPDYTLDPGLSASLEIEKKSGKTGSLVPLTALHADSNNPNAGHVYVLRQKNTTMGEQTVVEKIAVEIQEKNDQYAMVSGGLARDDKVVTGSSRSIDNGDRVREETA